MIWKRSGTSTFAKDFAAVGVKDSKGRSLRDFDLKTRIFKHPLSYLMYTESFDALPKDAKEQFYARLHEVLSGKDRSKDFEHLSSDDRVAVMEILRATKKDLPAIYGID